MKEFRISLLLVAEGGQWVVQCLEYDLAAQAATVHEALETFAMVFSAQVALDTKAGIEPLAKTPRAPAHVWDVWKSGVPLQQAPMLAPDMDSTPVRFEPPVTRLADKQAA